LAAWEAEASAAAAKAEDKDNDEDIDWSDNGPNPEEQAAQQRAIAESFESPNKM
jgi:hypothetical protein